MRGTSKIYSLWCVALTLLCFSCTVMDDLPIDPTFGEQLGGGRVRIALDISTPEAATAMTRSIPVENDTVLNGTFAVFCFDSSNELLFAVKTGDENANSNLSDDPDYTDSPAIAWHPNEGSHSGRLYIEAEETDQELHLLVIANVDTAKVAKLLGEVEDIEATIKEGMSLTEVAAELDKGLAIAVTDDEMQHIPMSGECDLENGITLGSKGSIYMRRSLARFTVRVEYTVDRLAADYDGDIENAPFAGASKVKLVNVNKYAAIYSPYTDEPNISVLNKSDDTPDGEETIDMEFTLPEGWQEGFDRDESEIYYKEVVFYVAETLNSRESYTSGSTDARISLLVSGVYHDYDGDVIDDNCYRLDLIPEIASSAEDEQTFIMRNYNYIFVVHDAVDRGSTSEEQALLLTIPDNFPFNRDAGENGIYVVVQDDEILSITVEWFTTDENQETPYYIGVSSTQAEMPKEDGACIRVKVVTNFVDEEGNVWSIDPYGIPIVTTDAEGNKTYAISFVWDDAAETLWAWLDYPEAVEVGETYTYYLVAGNIRKKMRITITEGDNVAEEP